MFTATAKPAATSAAPAKRAPAEEVKTSASSGASSQINLQYDWYQNVTHVFVAYKIKQGGEALANGGLKLTFEDTCMVLENS